MRLTLVLLAIALAACKRPVLDTVKAKESPAVSASVTKIAAEPFTAMISVTGTLVSNARVDVKAETTGRVTRFPKMEGDAVRAGEPVLWVEQENFELNVRQAASSVQVAEAGLARMRVLLDHQKHELERAQNLLESGGITDKDYKLAQVTEQEARTQVTLAEAQLEQARAALDVARKRLRDAVVKAPVSGEIQRKFVNEGAYVEPPTAVFTLVDNKRLELEAQVPASDIGPVRPGQRVTFTVNSYPNTRFEGHVIDLVPAVDTESRAAKVRIAVANSGGRLKAGMFAEGEVRTGIEQQAILIPVAALHRDDRSAKDSLVFVVEDGVARKRAVLIGRERDSRAEIVKGLKAGDLLLAEPSIEIADGVRVTPKEAVRVSQ